MFVGLVTSVTTTNGQSQIRMPNHEIRRNLNTKLKIGNQKLEIACKIRILKPETDEFDGRRFLFLGLVGI